jgi:hypothetical protein
MHIRIPRRVAVAADLVVIGIAAALLMYWL